MPSVPVPAMSPRSSSTAFWIGVVLTALGLLGHVLAAHAIGGYRVAYRDHIAGFVLILVVTGALIAGIGARFWPGNRARTMLIVGLVQALFGLWIYIERFHIA